MEMECLFFGESEKAFFKYEFLEPNRKTIKPVYPSSYYEYVRDATFKPPIKKDGEIRILSCDIATMGGQSNDASAYIMIRLVPNNKGYDRYVSYLESMVGGHTTTQAIRIKQLFYELDCDYLVLDTQNAGIGVYDALAQPLTDSEKNTEYEPWTCINDEKMASRCTYPNAPKIIYSIKATAQLNSDCAYALRDGLKRGKVKLLVSEGEGKEYLKSIKGYSSLPIEQQVKFESTFIQTTLLTNEMINLEGETVNNLLKLKEPSGKRKDRYSSIAYGNYIASELERNLFINDEVDEEDEVVYY